MLGFVSNLLTAVKINPGIRDVVGFLAKNVSKGLNKS
jgi:hypothetical protein